MGIINSEHLHLLGLSRGANWHRFGKSCIIEDHRSSPSSKSKYVKLLCTFIAPLDVLVNCFLPTEENLKSVSVADSLLPQDVQHLHACLYLF